MTSVTYITHIQYITDIHTHITTLKNNLKTHTRILFNIQTNICILKIKMHNINKNHIKMHIFIR